jgi:small-conductance mechanosensitive channel/CRP-like cAMP-binding protein
MDLTLATTQHALIAGVIAIAFYLGSVAIGRSLKRRAGVRLGTTYRLFCVVASLYFGLTFSPFNFAPFPDPMRELGAAATLLGAVVMIALIRRYFWELYFEQKRQMVIPKFLRDIFAGLIFLVALGAVLSVFYGQTITGVLIPSTVLVAIVGWALQDLLGNVISGLALQIGRPFKAGDWLIVDGDHAEVIEVNWRSTRLRTNDDVFLDLPNNYIVRNKVINLSYPTRLHAMRLMVGVDYAATPNNVKQILAAAALDVKGVLPSPAPKVYLREFGESAVNYEIKYWMENHALYSDIADGIRTNIWYALRRNQIKIPFPIRTLHVERRSKSAGPQIAPAARTKLHQQPFFQFLTDEQFDQLVGASRLVCFGKGEKIIEQGDGGESMFVLFEGTAGVFIRRGSDLAPVAALQAGEYFGEMSLLTGEQRTATVVAHSDCEVLEIDKSVFAEVLQDNTELLHDLSEMLAQRRMETEGIQAAASDNQKAMTKQREYTASFLTKLYSFFEL